MAEAPKERVEGEVRLQRANREQLQLVPTNLDELVAPDHPVRAVWELLGKLDLSKFTEHCRSRGENAGRPATDPRILATLWLYAASQGVGSARELARLCRDHAAYRWICGGVEVSHHTLSDFRVGHGQALDALLTEVLAVLMHQDLLPLARTVQDGMKVRASAGAASFHRQPTLEKCRKEAEEPLERLKAELDSAPQDAVRKAARRAAAAEDRLARIEKALSEMPKVREAKPENKRPDARISSTDPEARVMKMGDGGYRPAFNVPCTTDAGVRVIASVRVTNQATDYGGMSPAMEDVQRRTGRLPDEHIADGSFASREDIEALAARGVAVYAPTQKPKDRKRDPHQPRPCDTPGVADWRTRMGTPEAREIYKLRAATAETVNAHLRCFRGLDRFRVRGLPKVTCVVLWSVLAYNILRLFTLTA
jgi:transposase